MKIIHINNSDIKGGAARAAYRIHRSLVDQGLNSQMRVINKLSDDPTVVGGLPAGQNPIWRRLQPRLTQLARRRFRTDNPVLHSVAWPATGLGKELKYRHFKGQFDVAHLHWLGDSTLSIEEIGRLPMPIVWTLHDQWAFCGAEHYTSSSNSSISEKPITEERFSVGYSASNKPPSESAFDLNRLTWLRKNKAWRRSFHIVCPSTWLGKCVGQSYLMGNWPLSIIPNPIDLGIWAPIPKWQAREILGYPVDLPLVLFGADGGTADPRKGADLLLRGLQILKGQTIGTDLEKIELLIFGQDSSSYNNVNNNTDWGFPVHYFGRLNDDLSLRLLYTAADVLVIPSRQDNLPNTGLEAHACGIPVVAFKTGGLVDIIDDRVTGALAEPFDSTSLADAIRWVLEDAQRKNYLGVAARQRAEKLFNPARIANLYSNLYENALSKKL